MRRGVLLVVALAVFTFFAGLGRGAIGDSDEAFYAQAGREMLESGDWLTPHYNFEVRFQKPILFYWLVALAYRVAGVSAAAARWWPAASGLIMVLITIWAARRWFDRQTALAAGTITATSFGCIALARLALPDLPLATLTTATIVASLIAIFDPKAATRRWMMTAGAMAALAMLMKGPVGPLIAALAVGGAVIADRRTARLQISDLALAAVLFLVIATPWYGLMWARHGADYLRGFFVGDNLERFATSRFNDPRPFGFYVPILAAGLLPWTPFAVLWVDPAIRWIRRRASIGPTERRLLMWVLLPLLFFSVSVGKQPRYIVPLLPPLAMLLARSIQLQIDRASASRAAERLLRLAAAGCAGLMFTSGILLHRAQPLLDGFVDLGVVTAWSAATLVAAVVALVIALAGRLQHLVPAVALSAVVSALAVQIGALGPAGAEPVQEMARLVVEHRVEGQAVGTYRVMVRNLLFYTQLPQTDLITERDAASFLGRPEPVLCVMSRADREALEARTGQPLTTLGTVRYFNAAVVKPRTWLFPDPDRDVTTVELVSNR